MGLLNEEAKESFVLSSKNEEVPAAHALIDRGWGSIGPHLQGGQGVEAGMCFNKLGLFFTFYFLTSIGTVSLKCCCCYCCC